MLLYVGYCWIVAAVAGMIAASAGIEAARQLFEEPDYALDSALVSLILLAVTVAFAAGPLLPKRPWAWTFGLILLIPGLALSWLILPFWLSPKTRRHYRVD